MSNATSGASGTGRCTNCGFGHPREVMVSHSVRAAGTEFQGEVPATVCDRCGETLLGADKLMAFDLQAAGALAATGNSSPEALRFMRKAMRLTAVELGELLSLRPETISRVENGKEAADNRSVAVITALVMDKLAGSTAMLDRLRVIRRPVHLPKVVPMWAPREIAKAVPKAPRTKKVVRRRA
jgi:hypothetical protein